MNCAHWMLSNPKMPNCADTSSTQPLRQGRGLLFSFIPNQPLSRQGKSLQLCIPSRLCRKASLSGLRTTGGMHPFLTPSNKIGNSFFAPAASFGEANGGSYEERFENRQSHIAVLHHGYWFKRFVSIVPHQVHSVNSDDEDLPKSGVECGFPFCCFLCRCFLCFHYIYC